MFADLREPVREEKGYGIERVIDKQLLQRLLNSFSTTTRLFVAVTDVKGKCLLTSAQGECEFCRLIKADPVGRERCRGSYTRAGKQAAKWNEPYFFRCHAGLIAWACPILLDNSHIGNMICGQVLMWEPEELFWLEIKESTRDLGQDSEKLLEAARRLEIVSAAQVQAAADLLFIIANYLAQSGTNILQYQQKLRSIGSWLWVANYQHGKRTKEDSRSYFFDLERQLFTAIRQADAETAKNMLNKLAFWFFTRSKGQIEVIKGLCIELISSLARLATECGVKFEESFRYDLLRFKELEEADTVEKVFLWLLATGNSYIQLMTDRKYDEGETVIKKVIDYVQNNFTSPDLSLGEIAKACFISPAYLSRLFKRKMGIALMDYIRNVRIERAKLLLQQPERTASEVAKDVGYHDRSYFCKVFKKVVGLSPNEYRQEFLIN